MIVKDNFISSIDKLKQYAMSCEFADVVNPVDNVVYPNICKDIPQNILNDIMISLIDSVLLRAPIDPVCFMRMSKKGDHVPHKYHTDNSMGRYSLMLYLEDNDNAGTGFAKHASTGAIDSRIDEDELNKTIEDINDDSKWQLYKVVSMKKNRAVVFDSHLFHVALPIGGYGSAQKDSRIVFTCFFS